MLLVFAILLIIILVVLVRCIVIVPQSNAYVTEWLGVYKDTWGAGLPVQAVHADPARKAGLNVHKHNALLADGQRRTVRDRGTVRAAPTDEPGQHQAERNGRYNGKNQHLPAKADIKKADQHGCGSAHRKPDRDKRRCGGLDHDERHDGNQP